MAEILLETEFKYYGIVFSVLSNLPNAVLFNNPKYCDYLCFQQLIEGIAKMIYLLANITL